jgi:transposase
MDRGSPLEGRFISTRNRHAVTLTRAEHRLAATVALARVGSDSQRAWFTTGFDTLFAALCTLSGHVISKCMPRHRHQEWLKFLKKLDAEVPEGLDIHIICDNYATHKHERVQRWVAKNPRVHVHFTPTSASWLNMVERFFRDLTDKQIRRGVFKGVDDLIIAIDDYIARHNQKPKPFIWTKSARDILAMVMRAQEALSRVTGGTTTA